MKRLALLPGLAMLILTLLQASSSRLHAARDQRWVLYYLNFWNDSNVTDLQAVMTRAAQAGYTHFLIYDSKFSFLNTMDARYFNNVAKVKNTAAVLELEIVPQLFPIGYSNDLLFNDPNLIEAMPVTNSLLVVSNGVALPEADPPVAFRSGGSFANLSLWDWHDTSVVEDNGAARVTNPNGQLARVMQTINVTPFRQYHISVRVKTQAFLGTPEVKAANAGVALTYNSLGTQQTQDWQTHHVVFNSLTNRQVTVYFGCWDGTSGTLWWSNAAIQEVTFLNLVRRPGAPLVIRQEGGTSLTENVDFPYLKDPLMGTQPFNGCYDVYHAAPLLQVFRLTNGTRLRADWCHAVTVYNDQAMICPSEPATTNLLWDMARRVHAAFGAKGYVMAHDEIRVMNWCPACRQRQLDAGAMLADNVRTCIQILQRVNPAGRIYDWSDMFDPYHNAHGNYYLVRGNLTNSWLGLDPSVIILPWYFDQRENSMSFFSSRGHRQVIAGYYDGPLTRVGQWLSTAKSIPGVLGIMYCTWVPNYSDLEGFAGAISDFEIHNGWPLDIVLAPEAVKLEFPTLSGHAYALERSDNALNWLTWTNFTSSAAIGRCVDPIPPGVQSRYYRAVTAP